jgi:hypothetical protein
LFDKLTTLYIFFIRVIAKYSLSTLKKFQLEKLSEAASASGVASGSFFRIICKWKDYRMQWLGLPLRRLQDPAGEDSGTICK